jgi:hypothetical protein
MDHAYIEQVFQRRMIEITKQSIIRQNRRSPTPSNPIPLLSMRNKKGW